MADPTKFDDVIDSRDVIARIEALEERLADTLTAPQRCIAKAELAHFSNLAKQGADYSPDWDHGATLVRDSYFTEYAKELADDCGMVDPRAAWPMTCIDWEKAARELQQDYTSVQFADVTYWIR